MLLSDVLLEERPEEYRSMSNDLQSKGTLRGEIAAAQDFGKAAGVINPEPITSVQIKKDDRYV